MIFDKSNKDEILHHILRSLRQTFDIEEFSAGYGEGPFCAKAQFHTRMEKYVLVRSAKLWAAENHEYIYFVLADSLNPSDLHNIYSCFLKAGSGQVNPHKEHMFSAVTLVIIADSIDDKALKKIRRIRYSKSFRFSFWGWMEVRIAAIDCKDCKIISNRQGGAMKKHLKKVLETDITKY